MYMPLMVDIQRAVVFAGERGEGLQKTQKLALFADDLLVVSEAPPTAHEIVIPAGKPSELNENLVLKAERVIPIHPVSAAEADLDALIAGATFVTSDLTDRSLNERIRDVARRHHVLCNIIDTKDLCDTWFMSLIETDHLIAGLSTKAKATYYVTRLRKALEPRFARWELEAAYTATARERLRPDLRFRGLQKLWASTRIRLILFLFGPQAALAASQATIDRLNRSPKESA